MSATIMTLRDEAGNPVAPRTSANAVITESGVSVETALQQIGQGGGIVELPNDLVYMKEEEGDVSVAIKNVVYRYAPHNLLDNSDFRNPVNQRGQSSYTATGYSIDRWRFRATNGGSVTANAGNNCVRINAGTSGINGLYQQVATQDFTEKVKHLFGKPITIAVKVKAITLDDTFALELINSTAATSNGANHVTICSYAAFKTSGIVVLSGIMPESLTNQYLNFVVRTSSNCTSGYLDVEWAALYEGEYTAETLPPYVPKGYGAELAECQRYFQRYTGNVGFVGYTNSAAAKISVSVPIPVSFRARPSIVNVSGSLYLKGPTGGGSHSLSSYPFSVNDGTSYQNHVLLALGNPDTTKFKGNYILAVNLDSADITLSADL